MTFATNSTKPNSIKPSSSKREPLISVVMPVYNARTYLVHAMASIIEQTHRDWELICVNDGSTDASGDMLEWFAQQDTRIRVVHQANTGIVGALNAGCSLAKAPLICRMDQDDVALPNRLQMQLDHLRRNPACTVVGGAILEMDSDGDPLAISRLAVEHEQIVEQLLTRRTGHFHPTTMFRAEAFEAVGGYRGQYEWVEDHDLWLRLAQRGQLANLRDVVLCYRQHAQSICWQRSAQQRSLMNELLREAYRVRGEELPQHLIAEGSQVRAAAGPGKWARAAAKGGFLLSTLKHLRSLLQTDAKTSYKARMAVEASLRLLGGVARRMWSGERSMRVPQFPEWEQRWSRELTTGGSLAQVA